MRGRRRAGEARDLEVHHGVGPAALSLHEHELELEVSHMIDLCRVDVELLELA